MLPIIKAQETQMSMMSMQFGTGNMDKSVAGDFAKSVNRQASIREPQRVLENPEIKKAMLSSLGIGVIDMRSKNIDPKQKKELFPFNPS